MTGSKRGRMAAAAAVATAAVAINGTPMHSSQQLTLQNGHSWPNGGAAGAGGAASGSGTTPRSIEYGLAAASAAAALVNQRNDQAVVIVNESAGLDDGFRWRKYGQKQVGGSAARSRVRCGVAKEGVGVDEGAGCT